MNTLAVFIKKYSIGKSSPVLGLLEILTEYWNIDVYVQEVYYLNTPVLYSEKVRLFNVSEQNTIKASQETLKSIRQYTIHIAQNLINSLEHLDRKYDGFVVLDPHAFVMCKELFPEAKPIYFSLELYFRNNSFNMEYPEDFINRERQYIKDIQGLMIQSEERDQLFRGEYGISDKVSTFIFPVTYSKPSVKEKTNYLREHYSVPANKKIALHLGGIQDYHCCMELAMAFSGNTEWFLVFHGYSFGDYAIKLKAFIIENNLTNVIICDETFDNIDDMDKLLSSADAGIAWYKNMSPNFTSAGKSSGKISAYLRFGLPVIANRYRSSEEAIEMTGCGYCADRFEDIPRLLCRIEKNYAQLSENARNEYDKVYWLENYRASMHDFISKINSNLQPIELISGLAEGTEIMEKQETELNPAKQPVELIKAHVVWCWQQITEAKQSCALFGAGKHTVWLLELLQKYKLEMPEFIIDDNPLLKSLSGINVVSSNSANLDKIDKIILSTDTKNQEFTERIKALYPDYKGKIIDFYRNFPRGPYDKE